MSRRVIYPALLLLAAALPAAAQTPPSSATPAGDPNLSIASVKMDNGVRATQVIGGGVYSDPDTQIATVTDLVMTADDRVAIAVLNVGGVLGVGGKQVAIPYAKLKRDGDKTMLPGATKDSLNAMPSFTFSG